MQWGIKLFLISNEEGAKTQLYCATAPELAGVSGRYYDKSREVPPNRLAEDPALAAGALDPDRTRDRIRYPVPPPPDHSRSTSTRSDWSAFSPSTTVTSSPAALTSRSPDVSTIRVVPASVNSTVQWPGRRTRSAVSARLPYANGCSVGRVSSGAPVGRR